MKKFITLFSLIALFFIGMQHTQAQEKRSLDESQGKDKAAQLNEISNKERQNSPEAKAKVAKLEASEAEKKASYDVKDRLAKIEEVVTDLSVDQQSELHSMLKDLNRNLMAFESEGESEKAVDARSALNEEANLKIEKILNEEQLVLYKEYLVKSEKSEN